MREARGWQRCVRQPGLVAVYLLMAVFGVACSTSPRSDSAAAPLVPLEPLANSGCVLNFSSDP